VILVDSSVLVRLADLGDPDHEIAIGAIERLLRREVTLYVTLQNLCEAWRVMTGQKTRNGLAFPISVADTELGRLERLFALLPEDTPAVTTEWRRLIVQHRVVDIDVFDARLAATVIVHKLEAILTFDTGFARYGVNVLDPATV
jgi:predicted nucleic acid-binding protein